MIYDSSYQPKPAYNALKEALEQGVDSSPTITSAARSSNKLLITGERFMLGAELFLNGERQKKVSNDSTNASTGLVVKKLGKRIKSGDVLLVKNPDGFFSNEFIYP